MPASRSRDPYRLLPTDAESRSIALDLYERVADRPIISPHGHVPARLLDDNLPFRDPADLFVSTDHYVTRLLHASGVPLELLGVGGQTADPLNAWKALASNWHIFAGTASGYWLAEELSMFFGVDDDLDDQNAEQVYHTIAARLQEPDFLPRKLFSDFGLEVLATTDDPLDDLSHHARLRRSGLSGRVIPTFRPDAYLDPCAPLFLTKVEKLLAASGSPSTFPGYLSALEERRAYFIEHGAVSTDHGVLEPLTMDLAPGDAERIFQAVLTQTADANEQRQFRAHMLFQMARMSVFDGLVMTIHAGVLRNHSSATLERFGPDTGHDIPVHTTFTEGLRPMLESFGLEKNLHIVLFTVDETAYSRELAPLAGFYPSVYVGAPWWFLDAPDAIGRYRSAVTETAGLYRTSGFIDDTRAFLSIPARHDAARRADAAFLARMVREGRMSVRTAGRVADDLVDAIPKQVFKL